MAQDLPFSIANILRSDFPHPSRINKAPNILPHVAPLRGTGKVPFVALRCQLDRRIKSCSETPGFFSYSAPTIRSRPDKDDYQNPKTEQRPKRSTEISSEGKFLNLNFFSSLPASHSVANATLMAVLLKNVVVLITHNTSNVWLKQVSKFSNKYFTSHSLSHSFERCRHCFTWNQYIRLLYRQPNLFIMNQSCLLKSPILRFATILKVSQFSLWFKSKCSSLPSFG